MVAAPDGSTTGGNGGDGGAGGAGGSGGDGGSGRWWRRAVGLAGR